MKRFLSFALLLIVLSIFLVAFRPMQEVEPATATWRDVFKVFIFLATALLGAPITQVLKKALGAEGRWAVVILAVVSGILGFLELWLSGVLDFSKLTLETWPGAFIMVVGVSSLYFAWFKESPSFFGQKALLKPTVPKEEPPL